MDEKSKGGRIRSSDGWRGISIVLVLLSHEWATSGVPSIHLIVDDWRVWWLPALIVAHASYYLYERRFIALRRRNRPASLPSD